MRSSSVDGLDDSSSMLWMVVALAFFVLVGWKMHQSDSRRMRQALDPLAARHGGRVTSSALYLPRLDLPVADTTLVVSALYGEHASTFAIAKLAGEHRLFELCGRSLEPVHALLGSRELETGDAEFDLRFRVRSPWAVEVDALLDEAVRKALLAAPSGRKMSLRVRRTRDGTPRLDLDLDGVATDPDELTWLAETALLLLQRLRPGRAAAA